MKQTQIILLAEERLSSFITSPQIAPDRMKFVVLNFFLAVEEKIQDNTIEFNLFGLLLCASLHSK